MGIELMEIGVKMRKVIIFIVRGCYRSVCNHPFLVGMLCFLILLYRSCPVIFSLLVSASPVLVCTAVLLGTLLSFGQPNIPEIEIEEKTTHKAVPLKTGLSSDVNATVIEKNESHYVERYSESKKDEPERANSSSGKEIGREVGLDDTAPLIEERSREVELDGGDLRFSDGEVMPNKYAPIPNLDDDEHLELDGGDFRYERKVESCEERFSDEEVTPNKYASLPNMDDDDEKAETDSFDSERVNVDSLGSPPRSPWTRIEDPGEEEEEDDVSDSESDRAESSSPDASMADIMPMLDELHPLLDEDAPQPVHISRDESPRSRTDGHDTSDDESENHDDLDDHDISDDESENHDDLDGPDDDNEDEEGDKDEPTKCAITWTEEDQKNLMDLGTSEIERNVRLENLIMRRRARKNMSMIQERNLIDLEISDVPFNIAPITARRQNPFDSPRDGYDDNLPPIPGSAPSILLPRRNPFDIPYDSSEEKPDLMGDGFQEEFTRNQTRDSFFRRHESFNIRPSGFGPNRRGSRMRPFFVPEGTVSEESSFSFQRQSSELSDYSKVSSVPETESIGSVEDLEERKVDEEHNQHELEAGPETKVESEVGPSHNLELISREVIEEEDSSVLGRVEKENAALQLGVILEQENMARPEEVETSGYHSNFEGVQQRYSRDSSSSSLSEVSERVFTVTEGDEDLSIVEEAREFVAEEPEILSQTSVESIASTSVNEAPHREPVYDLSPRELRKNFSSSSISSDLLVESSIIDQDEYESRLLDVPSKSSLEASIEENVAEQYIQDTIQVSEPPFEGQLTEESVINEPIQSPNFDADNESNEKLISASSAEQDPSFIFDNAIEERRLKHVNEVEASNTSVELLEDVGIQNLNTSEIQKLDHDTSLNINLPLSPEFISIPSTSSEAITSRVDFQTVVEEVDDIGEIDEGLLSELDSVGDFSISTSNVFAKHTDSFKVNKIENQIYTENLEEEREAQPVYSMLSDDGDKEIEKPILLEPPQSELASAIGPSHETSILELRPIEEVSWVNKEVNSDYDILHVVKSEEAEGTSLELHGVEPDPSESTFLALENMVDGKTEEEVKPTSDVVSVAISAIASKEPVCKESPNVPLEEESNKDREISGVASEQAELKVEAEGSFSEFFVEEPVFNVKTNLPSEEMADGFVEDQMKTNSNDVSLEVKKDEDISAVTFERPEQKIEAQGTSSELLVEEAVPKEITNLPLEEVIVVDGNVGDQVKTNSDDVSLEIKKDGGISAVAFERPEQKVEAQGTSSELLVEEVVSREITNLPLEEVRDGNTEKNVKPISDDASIEIIEDREISVIAFEHTELKIEQQGTSSESHVEELISNESTNLPLEDVVDGNTENQVKPHSNVAFEQAELEGDSSKLLVPEPVSEQSTNLPLEEVIDGDTEKPVKPNYEDASLEVMKDREMSTVAFEKPEHVEEPVPSESTNLPSEEEPKHKVEAPQDVHLPSSVKGKGKLSRSSSSSSSSSSESSSDSD